MSPSVGPNDLNAGVGDLLSMSATAIVLLQSASHRATIVGPVCHLTAKVDVKGCKLLTFERIRVSPTWSWNEITVYN